MRLISVSEISKRLRVDVRAVGRRIIANQLKPVSILRKPILLSHTAKYPQYVSIRLYDEDALCSILSTIKKVNTL